jgi:SAM-dependent methyltransferase
MTTPAVVLKNLFAALDAAGYSAEPLTPDRLQKARAAAKSGAAPATALLRRFQLGLDDVSAEDLGTEGLSPEILAALPALEAQWGPFVVSRAAPAAQASVPPFVLHTPWPPVAERAHHYAHFGAESYALARFMTERNERWNQARQVLDLGCASGAVGFFAANALPQARIQGVDICENALEMGRAAADAQGLRPRMEFLAATLTAEPSIPPPLHAADLVVFNPPMVMADPGFAAPHRDGGHLGLELPLLFAKVASRHLRPQGHIYCLATNPIRGGRSLFFDELKSLPVKITDQRCLDDAFNQNVARKRGHEAAGIDRVELWALELSRA